jgi:hypothetical protein
MIRLTVSLLLLTCISVVAQTPTVYVPSGTTGIGTSTNSNVGINTTSPGLAQHVVGDNGWPVTSGTTQTGILRLQGTGSNAVLDFSTNGSAGASLQATHKNDLSYAYPIILNPNGGNVGIGTTNPQAKFQVDGTSGFANRLRVSGAAVGSSASYDIVMGNDPQWAAGIKGYVPAGQPGIDRVFLGFYTTTFSGALQSRVERLTITDKGNVGIGTVTPDLAQHVVGGMGWPAYTGTAQTGVLRLQGTGSSGVLDFSVNGGSGASLQVTNRTDLSLKYPLVFNPNGGNVGIGTTAPSATLHTVSANNNTFYMNSLSSTSQSNITLFNDTGTGGLAMSSYGSSYAGNAYARANGSAVFTTSNSAGAAGMSIAARHASGYITLHSGGDTERMRIASDGKVGIGTNAPDALLAVKGTVHAQEVIVDLNGAVAPDYVFESTYELPSLQDVQSYIAANKHLPEVPSAKEMEEKGINLGEMNLILLKKIEELTLYSISQDRALQQLIQQNIDLVQRLKKLEEKIN